MGEELSTTSCPVLTEALLCIMKASLWTVVCDTVIKMGSITTTPIFCAMRPELQLERMIPINVCWLDGPEMVFQSMGIVRTLRDSVYLLLHFVFHCYLVHGLNCCR